jgi:nucleotide-binding universal stress UspA family protein
LRVEGNRPGVNIDCVVFATDFSTASENAGHYAQQLARYYSARLIVAHAFHSSQAAMEAEALSHNLSRQREELFSRLTAIAHGLNGGSVEPKPILLEGNTESLIAGLADKNAPSMIVLGTQGRGRVERELIASASERILRSTPWPCLVVGPHVPRASPHAVPFQRILYATDFTPEAANAAIYAISLASEAGAHIDVLNVVPPKTIEHPDRLAELEKNFYHELDRLVPGQAREFCKPRSFVETGNAHRRIHEHIQQHNIDLLVIGVRNSAHLEFEIRASDAFRLVVESPCPVLTIRG